MAEVSKELQVQVDKVIALEKDAADQIRALKSAQEQIDEFWKTIKDGMIGNDIKSIKGEWGSITIAERQNFKIDLDLLPSKFIKKVPDTARIAASYKLEGKPPKGTEPYTTKYLTKRIK